MSEREKLFEQLSGYLDGELSPSEAQQLEKALQTDEELAAELSRLRKLRELLRKTPRARAPDDFAAHIMEQAAKAHLVGAPGREGKRGRPRWIRYLATAAVLIVTVGVGAVIVKTLQSPTIEDLAPTRTPDRELARADAAEPGGPTEKAYKADDGIRSRDITSDKPIPKLGKGPVEVRSPTSVTEKVREGATPAFGYAKRGFAFEPSDADLALTSAVNEEIDTDDLQAARRQVETVLDSNSLVRLKTDQPITEELLKQREVLANVYQVNRDTSRQVQYVAFVPRAQMTKLRNDLANVRMQQRVAQRGKRPSPLKEDRLRYGKGGVMDARSESEEKDVYAGVRVAEDKADQKKVIEGEVRSGIARSAEAPARPAAPAEPAPRDEKAFSEAVNGTTRMRPTKGVAVPAPRAASPDTEPKPTEQSEKHKREIVQSKEFGAAMFQRGKRADTEITVTPTTKPTRKDKEIVSSRLIRQGLTATQPQTQRVSQIGQVTTRLSRFARSEIQPLLITVNYSVAEPPTKAALKKLKAAQSGQPAPATQPVQQKDP